MVRYLGQKRVNWPAIALVFGWIVLSGAYLLSGMELVSTFRAMLSEAPQMWWMEMSFPGFILTMSPLLVGALALWLFPISDGSLVVGVGLVVVGALLLAAGIAWDAGSGIALYRDRVVHRASGFGQPLETDRFTDIRRVEKGCAVIQRRGHSDPEPSYILQFASGNRIDIWRGSPSSERGSAAERFAVILAADAAAIQAGAALAPMRKPDGTLIGQPGCIARLSNDLMIPLPALRAVFRVHPSELKPEEYIIVPQT